MAPNVDSRTDPALSARAVYLAHLPPANFQRLFGSIGLVHNPLQILGQTAGRHEGDDFGDFVGV